MAAAAPLVVALLGPTATGKTEAALRVAAAADVDLISVDSAMVYRRMDIGTAKPTAALLARYPHALVDVVDPAEVYSLARFVTDADALVRASLAAGRTPVLVGGSMAYFRAFKAGINDLPEADAELRESIAARAAARGWPALHGELASRDPAAAACIDAHNGRRIQRALEVLELTGRSITAHWSQATVPAAARLGCRLLEIAIVADDRDALGARIDARLEAMLGRGLVAEVAALRAEPGLSMELPSMRAVGYRQVWRHLDGACGYAEMVRQIAVATRRTAKRQLTWLRAWDGLAAVTRDADAAAARVLDLL